MPGMINSWLLPSKLAIVETAMPVAVQFSSLLKTALLPNAAATGYVYVSYCLVLVPIRDAPVEARQDLTLIPCSQSHVVTGHASYCCC